MTQLHTWIKRVLQHEMLFFWMCALIYAVGALCLILQPLPKLIVTILPDDTFYYYQIAKHVAQGLGSTFDGIASTNGYHPLWMVILVPFFRFLPDVQAIQGSLLLEATIYLIAAGLIFKYLQLMIANKIVRNLAFMAWFFNPFLLAESINGLETSVSILCLTLFVWMLSKWKANASNAYVILLGAMGGLMLLTRTDFIIYYIVLVGYQLYQRRQTFFKDGMRLGLGTGAVLLPWLVWNIYTFGTIVQVSGAAYTLAQYQRVFISSAINVGRPWLFVFAKASFSTTMYGLEAIVYRALYAWLAFLTAGMCLATFLSRKASPATEDEKDAWSRVIPSLLVAGVIYVFVEVCLRWSIRSWYFAHSHILVWVGLAYAYQRSSVATYINAIKVRWFIPVLGIMLSSWIWVGYKEVSVGYANQEEFIQAATWMNEHVPTGSKIGVFNSGIQTFLSRHQVINLDGLVNNQVYPYLKKRDLLTYIREQDIAYISDFYKVIFGKFGDSWGVNPYTFFTQGKPITTLKMFDPAGIYLYKISEQGQNPATTSTKP